MNQTAGSPAGEMVAVSPRRYNVPADMTLVCRWCPHRYPDTVTVAACSAHAAEHDGVDLTGNLIEMVALCRRCGGPMTFVRLQGQRSVFDCVGCHRTRTVSRRAWDAL